VSLLRAADRSLADSPLTYALHPLRFSRADAINLPGLSLPHVLPTILPSIAAPQEHQQMPNPQCLIKHSSQTSHSHERPPT